ncbi:hypothetical protein G1H11_21150 [Phytoactinopolyspora alkaliphila]|uniref:Uncharacterized protein n=1 Tax=Phytoactinopolyspora alkaliphila TaxID=1783498 RepID=A0A6N9YS84_9ACTN|nr:hypothetical protein [Phytoactinopolyspora alkaliphila]NED97810.1 hypothetical protein [Phytoactinopolyspora alkaliphila]
MAEGSGQGSMRSAIQVEKVRRYLDELDAALAERGVVDRAEIVASIREHIESDLAEREPSDDDVDRVLASLGDPLTIAAEACGSAEADGAESHAAAHRGSLDERGPGMLAGSWVPAAVVALVMLSSVTLFFYLPVVTFLIGLVLLWASTLWTPWEKLLGTFVLPLPGVAVWVVLGGLFLASTECVSESSSVEVGSGGVPEVSTVCTGGLSALGSIIGAGLLIAAVTGGIAAAVVLYRRGMSRVL